MSLYYNIRMYVCVVVFVWSRGLHGEKGLLTSAIIDTAYSPRSLLIL